MGEFPTRFLECLPYTLIQECPFPHDWSNHRNFSNDAHDPGGATMCGITQGEYTVWRKHQGLPSRAVHLLTQDEGYRIYLQNYWLPECPKLPPGLDLEFFDTAVNEGTHAATQILQYVLEIHSDGLWGPQTDGAVAAIKNVPATVLAFTKRREVVYSHLRNFIYFGKDWELRAAEIGATSLKMSASTMVAELDTPLEKLEKSAA